MMASAAILLPGFQSVGPEGTVCTQDAKVCPDGSVVGRVAPDCQFEPCVTAVGLTAEQKAAWMAELSKLPPITIEPPLGQAWGGSSLTSTPAIILIGAAGLLLLLFFRGQKS